MEIKMDRGRKQAGALASRDLDISSHSEKPSPEVISKGTPSALCRLIIVARNEPGKQPG